MAERQQPDRWRCLSAGCNPVLDEKSAATHNEKTQHRVAKWPQRSQAGAAKARARNRSGYYDRYNVGAKSAAARGIVSGASVVDGRTQYGGQGGDDLGQWLD